MNGMVKFTGNIVDLSNELNKRGFEGSYRTNPDIGNITEFYNRDGMLVAVGAYDNTIMTEVHYLVPMME